MIDIKERLRAMELTVCKEAADHIEQQEAEIARLRKDADGNLQRALAAEDLVGQYEEKAQIVRRLCIEMNPSLADTSTQEVG